jgi:hypothetical protein
LNRDATSARGLAQNDCSCAIQVLGYSKPQHVPSQPLEGDPTSAVQLLSYPAVGKCRLTITPFGGKLEIMLRLAGISYTGLCGDVTNPKHAPKRKVHRIVFHLDGLALSLTTKIPNTSNGVIE